MLPRDFFASYTDGQNKGVSLRSVNSARHLYPVQKLDANTDQLHEYAVKCNKENHSVPAKFLRRTKSLVRIKFLPMKHKDLRIVSAKPAVIIKQQQPRKNSEESNQREESLLGFSQFIPAPPAETAKILSSPRSLASISAIRAFSAYNKRDYLKPTLKLPDIVLPAAIKSPMNNCVIIAATAKLHRAAISPGAKGRDCRKFSCYAKIDRALRNKKDENGASAAACFQFDASLSSGLRSSISTAAGSQEDAPGSAKRRQKEVSKFSKIVNTSKTARRVIKLGRLNI